MTLPRGPEKIAFPPLDRCAVSADDLRSLEFPAVLAIIASMARGAPAANRIRSLTPGTDRDEIVSTLADISELIGLAAAGQSMEIPVVADLHPALARLRQEGSVLDAGQLGELRRLMHAGRTMVRELDRVSERAPRLARYRVEPVTAAQVGRIDRAVDDDGELLDSASPALAAARSEVHKARSRLIQRLEAILGGLESPGSVTLRDGRYVIPVRRDDRRRPDGIVHDESSSAGTLFIEPTSTIGLGNAFRSAIVAAEREELTVLRELTAMLRPEHDSLADQFDLIVALDSFDARARWAVALDATPPRIGAAGGRLVIHQGRHPLLLARGVAVVPFDLILQDGDRTLLVTGPNAGGKTVLLKTTALIMLLAQSGIVPPVGPESELPIISKLFVDIGDHQSIEADLSTFSAHVATLRKIIDEADDTTMVVLDEVGSGTDPVEGGALAMAILQELTARKTLTLATTHLGALKELATRVPGVVNGSLHFDEATLSPSYRFTPGVPGRSYGLAIARRLGMAADVLATAEALVPQAERELDRLLAVAEARHAELERQLLEVAERLAEVELRELRLSTTERAHAERDQELRQRERSAERDMARRAKAYLLEARKRVEASLDLARGAVDEAQAREARRLVEEGVRVEAERLDEPAEPARGDPGKLRVGATVALSTGASGELQEIRSDGRAVVLVGSMRLVVAADTLAMVRERTGSRERRELHPATEVIDREPVGEVDLRGMRADEAELGVLAALDGAVMSGQPSLNIIHGMGTGVVREIVQRIVGSDRRVAGFEFAPRNQGGTGVTVVTFR